MHTGISRLNKEYVIMTTSIVKIGDIGFVFAVNNKSCCNLISPSILSFFNIPESDSATEDAFQMSIPKTNQSELIFKNEVFGMTLCSDGKLRRCRKVKCDITMGDTTYSSVFHADKSINTTL